MLPPNQPSGEHCADENQSLTTKNIKVDRMFDLLQAATYKAKCAVASGAKLEFVDAALTGYFSSDECQALNQKLQKFAGEELNNKMGAWAVCSNGNIIILFFPNTVVGRGLAKAMLLTLPGVTPEDVAGKCMHNMPDEKPN